jgi:hypothetical protein
MEMSKDWVISSPQSYNIGKKIRFIMIFDIVMVAIGR